MEMVQRVLRVITDVSQKNDVLIDFQTEVTFPVLVRYIYNFRYYSKCICVYIPTLVALFGLCFDLTECFWDLHVWYRTMGNMSSNLQYMSQIMANTFLFWCHELRWVVSHVTSVTLL